MLYYRRYGIMTCTCILFWRVAMLHGPFIPDLYYCDIHQREENKVCHAGALCLSPLTAAHGGNGTLLSLGLCSDPISYLIRPQSVYTQNSPLLTGIRYEDPASRQVFLQVFYCSVCQNAWTNLTTMASLRMVAKLRAGVVGCTKPFRYALKTTRSPVKLLHTVNWNYCVGVVKGECYTVARLYRWDRRVVM